MAAHERRTSNLCASVIIGTIVISCLCVMVTDAIEVDQDGDITFDPLPSLGEFQSKPNEYKSDGMRPGMLGDMARGWVDLVQPNGFPFDYIDHLIRLFNLTQNMDDINLKDEIFLGMKTFVGIIICFLIGIFVFLLLPWIGLIFCCCRFCNNCGGKRVQEETKSMGCVRVTYTLILLCVTGIVCAGMAFTNVDNDFMGHAVEKSFMVASDEILPDASTFLAGSDNQLTNILVSQYADVELQINEDLDNIGMLIGEPFQDYLKDEADVQETFDAFNTLILDLEETTMRLDHINNSSDDLQTSGIELQDNLTDITLQLNNINVTCSGCVPSNDGLDVTDFSLLPDVLLNLVASRNVERNVTEEYNKVLGVFNSIPDVIEDLSDPILPDIKDALSETKTALQDTATSFSDQIDTFKETIADTEKIISDAKDIQDEYDQYRKKEGNNANSSDWKSAVHSAWRHKDDYNYYRQYTVIGLCCMVLLIVMFNIIGLTMGTCAYKNVTPVDRSRMSNAGGNVLVAGVVFTFLFIPLLILLCCLFFMSLAVVTLTCKPMSDLTLYSKTIDQPDLLCNGYCLGDFLLGDPTINLTISGMLESCGRNESLYSSLMLGTVFNSTIIDEQLEQIRQEAELIIDEITLDDFDLDLVPDNFKEELQAAIDAIRLDSIDYQRFEDLLMPPPVPTDLNIYANDLDQAADDLEAGDPTSAAQLRNIAEILRSQYANTVVPMMSLMNDALENAYRTQNLDAILDRDVNYTSTAAFRSESLIQAPETESALTEDVTEYVDTTIGYAEQYSNWAFTSFEEDFARCHPIRTVYDTAINTICYYGFDSLNIFWLTLGWCVFFLFPSIIFSIKLAKYYRIMDDLYEPKPKKPKKSKSRSRGEENYPMGEMDDMPPTGHGHHDNIRLVNNDRGPSPMMAQQNPHYIPDEPIMAYHQYNDLGRPMAPPPAYHPEESRLAENKAALIRELKLSNQGSSTSSIDHDQWPMRGVGPSQSSMLLPPYGYYPSIDEALPGPSAYNAQLPPVPRSQGPSAYNSQLPPVPSGHPESANFDAPWPHWGHQQAFEYGREMNMYHQSPPWPSQAGRALPPSPVEGGGYPSYPQGPSAGPSGGGGYPSYPQGSSQDKPGNKYNGIPGQVSYSVYNSNKKYDDSF